MVSFTKLLFIVPCMLSVYFRLPLQKCLARHARVIYEHCFNELKQSIKSSCCAGIVTSVCSNMPVAWSRRVERKKRGGGGKARSICFTPCGHSHCVLSFFLCFPSLVQWLKHSRKEYCELCKHRFAFTPSK